MVAVTSGKILVSGANGFLGIYVVRDLLEAGYSVRGTVRSKSKATHLEKLFSEYSDRLEIIEVPDITAAGAFDEAVKDVQGIAHTASPFHYKADDPQELIGPAVEGTLSILRSATKHGKDVKRIVVTSSNAAVFTPGKNGTYSEKDWNLLSREEVKAKGRDATVQHKYMASKSLAEQAAWDYVAENKPSWDLTTVCPTFIFGKVIHEISQASDLNTSNELLYKVLVNGEGEVASNWVDVQDASEGHVKAFQMAEAGGKRFITSGSQFHIREFNKIAHKQGIISKDKLAQTSDDLPKVQVFLDTTRSKEILGLKYHSKEDMLELFSKDLVERGWL